MVGPIDQPGQIEQIRQLTKASQAFRGIIPSAEQSYPDHRHPTVFLCFQARPFPVCPLLDNSRRPVHFIMPQIRFRRIRLC